MMGKKITIETMGDNLVGECFIGEYNPYYLGDSFCEAIYADSLPKIKKIFTETGLIAAGAIGLAFGVVLLCTIFISINWDERKAKLEREMKAKGKYHVHHSRNSNSFDQDSSRSNTFHD